LFILPEVFLYEQPWNFEDPPANAIVWIAHKDLAAWRSTFAIDSLGAWQRGGQVWLSKRILADRPKPDWGWTEGDDPRVSWPEIPAFARSLATDREAGAGDDGFVRVAETPANREFLERLAKPQTAALH
jgi:hypothetical protein